MSAVIRSRFYLVAALIAATFVVLGFARSYYLRPLFNLPPLTLLLHLHALAFTAWVGLFIVQARLAAARRLDWHRRLGIAGGVTAALMVLTTGASIVVAMQGDKVIAGEPAWQFVARSSVSILLFAGFVTAALWLRRRSDWHRRLMVLATLSVLGPAVGRLLMWVGGPVAISYTLPLLLTLLAACFVYDAVKHRLVHPAYVTGAGVLLLAIPAKEALAHSQLWADFARWMVSG